MRTCSSNGIVHGVRVELGLPFGMYVVFESEFGLSIG